MSFSTILCPSSELHLEATLQAGQSFRWISIPVAIKNNSQNQKTVFWRGVIDDTCYDLLEMNPHILIRDSKTKNPLTKNQLSRIRDYFFLEVSLADLVDNVWCGMHNNTNKNQKMINNKNNKNNNTTKEHALVTLFRKTIAQSREEALLKRVRLLKQDPIEMIFSFLCSQNNHLKRITSMINLLSSKCGKKVFDGDEYDSRPFFEFPSCTQIAKISEEFWRENGFGYRAKYIVATAKQIANEKGQDAGFIKRVNDAASLQDARNVLLELCGIGRKVADCILLSGFKKFDVSPMDTHMIAVIKAACPKEIAKVAASNNKPKQVVKKSSNVKSDDDQKKPKKENFSLAQHDEAQRLFTEAFGPLSGWAQLVFFVSRVSGGNFVGEEEVSSDEVITKSTESGKRRQREE